MNYGGLRRAGTALLALGLFAPACSGSSSPRSIGSAHDLVRKIKAHGVTCSTDGEYNAGNLAANAWLCELGGSGELKAIYFSTAHARDTWITDITDGGDGTPSMVIGPTWVIDASTPEQAQKARQIVGGVIRA